VIVNDLNIVGITFAPPEANTPALVDADTVVAFPVSRELLQVVAGREPEVGQALSIVQHSEFPVRNLLDVGREPGRPFPVEDEGGLLVPNRLDHGKSV
jgi:hypothetical protein